MLYDYSAVDAEGRRIGGRMEAMNPVDLEMRLKHMGLDLVRGKPIRHRPLLGGSGVPRRELINFCFQLQQLIRAGVPLLDALTVMTDQVRQTAPAADPRTIPIYTSPSAAGFAAPVFGEDYELIPVTGDVPPGAELAVRIQGDSMAPVIADGAVVYVNHDPVQSGDVGIFCVDGDMLCKQYYRDPLGMVYLFSLNRKRADMDVIFHRGSGRSLTCFGRVMLHAQPLPEGHI